MIALDLDGTVTQYGKRDEPARFNESLLGQIADYTFRTAYLDQNVTIVTNQGGMAFSAYNAKYASPFQVFRRLDAAARWLSDRFAVQRICVATYHPRATADNIATVTQELIDHMRFTPWRVDIIPNEEFRKPQPHMLWLCGANIFYGDDDVDELAARVARCEFVRVPRFE